MSASQPLLSSELSSLTLLSRGKVRDIYAIDAEHLLIVATDRISAFDVVLPDPIPDKGAVLTAVSEFWFDRTADTIENHRTSIPLSDIVNDPDELAQLEGRSTVARRLSPLPIEAIVRGYLIGSGWKDYQRSRQVCGIPLPAGLRQADRLPETLFTPSTKAEVGAHDQNIDFAAAVNLVGLDIAERVRAVSLELYRAAAEFALERGIIIADTKFEFGLDAGGNLVLIDEVLTPDSSRFWPADEYQPGTSPPSFDKQFVRDYLESVGWNKRPPAPALPADIAARTAQKYREARERLLG